MLSTTTKRVPKVLFLRNVFLHDCMDIAPSFESKLLSTPDTLEDNNTLSEIPISNMIEMSDSINASSALMSSTLNLPNSGSLMELTELSPSGDYQRLPKIFESLETWPKSTNLHCWYCTNRFSWLPKTIPLVIEPNVHSKNGDKYLIGVEGNCCRWSCCVSYIQETNRDITKAVEKINNLYFFIQLWTGKYPVHIPIAPSKYLLKKFGGDLTTEQYYNLYDKLEKDNLL